MSIYREVNKEDVIHISNTHTHTHTASQVALVVKNLPANARAGDTVSIPGSGRSPGEGNGNPLQYSCLENPMGREAWWATVHGVTKSWTRQSDFTFIFFTFII